MCAIVEDYANKVAAEREKKAVEKANRQAVIKGLAIYQLVVDIFKFPRFFFPGLLMALA